MKNKLSPIIQAAELAKIIDKENLVIIDASFHKHAKENYDNEHIVGALYVNLNEQLSDIKQDAANGGRHPLPSIDKFKNVLQSLGIDPASHVVIYDDKNGSIASARFWWMLRSIGHEKVQVLNGGFKEAIKANIPRHAKTEQAAEVGVYLCEKWQMPTVDIMDVEKLALDEKSLVVDVRAPNRYNGLEEPIDLIAGHIPGAINIPFSQNLDEQGLFKSPDSLRAMYQAYFKNRTTKEIAFHCGSGVTACHSLLAIAYAGLEIPPLYVGSWSEWSRNEKPMTLRSGD